MSITRGGCLQRLLATLALGWAVFGLLWALMIVLPAPHLALWFVAALVEESSLLLAAFALVGVALAALTRIVGVRRVSLVAAALGAATVVLSLMPVAQASRTASAEGVALSPSGLFARPAVFAERQPETVTYARPGEDAQELDVWRPSGREDAAGGSEGRPAVVVVHGGGWEWGSRSETPRWDEWLSDRGYVVFDVDYRLAPPPRWKDAPGDVKCAVGWVKENAERYGVDPDRVALMGYSSGGHLALLAAYTGGDPRLPPSCDVEDTGVEAVAAFSPPTDLTRAYEMEWPWWKPDVVGLGGLRRFLGSTPSAVPERYRLADLPRRRARPADLPRPRRRRPDSPVRAVRVARGAASGSGCAPPLRRAPLGQPRLRVLLLGWLGFAGHPPRSRTVLRAAPRDARREVEPSGEDRASRWRACRP